jgi:hypothetical protein
MNRRSRLARLAAWTGAAVLAGVALAVGVVYLLASSTWGHSRVLSLTLHALGPSVNGQLTVRRVDGNLLSGARLHGLSLKDSRGRPFVVADSADLTYDVRSLLSPRIYIHKLVMYNPDIHVMRMPGDSMWNYEAIFADTSHASKPPAPVERVTSIDSVQVVNARARVDMPWEPTPGLSPRAKKAQIAEALSDTSLVLVRRVPGGMVRTMNFTGLNGRMSAIRFAPGTKAGSFFRVDTLSGRAQIFRGPTLVSALKGRLSLVPNRVEFDLPTLDMPHSHFTAAGTVTTPPDSGDMIYDVTFDGKRVEFRDLTWLYPRFPRDMRGTLTLDMETHPGGVLYHARNAVINARGTRIAGSFGLVVGDTLRFTDVDLRADPLRMATIESMLPQKLPVVGLYINSALVRGSSTARKKGEAMPAAPRALHDTAASKPKAQAATVR